MAINFRTPLIDAAVRRYPTGAVGYLQVIDDKEMYLSAHTTYEPDRQGQLRIAVGAENKNSFGVYLTVEAVVAFRDACDQFLRNQNRIETDTVTGNRHEPC